MAELTTTQAARAYEIHPNVLNRLILMGRFEARKNAKELEENVTTPSLRPKVLGEYPIQSTDGPIRFEGENADTIRTICFFVLL